MRLFFASFPDSESRRNASAAVQALKLPATSRCLPPENYHITWIFLGEVPDDKAEAVREVGDAQRIGCFSLRFDRWEYWHKARAVVASTSDRPEALLRLRASLAAGLTQRGVAFDDKPLRPHITVARKLAQAPVLTDLSEFGCTLRTFCLVSSATAAAGPVYTVVDTWALLDTAAGR
ncbi:MAG: RNA 2',3'-cyclic phosphodiesterase [Steroidobacteraceae bacterium]|jgi:2'-5' RNA ligase